MVSDTASQVNLTLFSAEGDAFITTHEVSIKNKSEIEIHLPYTFTHTNPPYLTDN